MIPYLMTIYLKILNLLKMIDLVNSTLTLHNYLLESRPVKLLEKQNWIRNQNPKLKLENCYKKT
jgi:hypothetical protein